MTFKNKWEIMMYEVLLTPEEKSENVTMLLLKSPQEA